MVDTTPKGRVRKNAWRNPKKHGRLHSTKVAFSRHKHSRSVKRLLPKLANYVWKHCFEDDLKAPGNNPPKPALTSKPAFNIYLGTNVPKTPEEEATRMGVKRTSYGLGSGASSIGLNPETMRIYAVTDEALKLMEYVTKIVQDASEHWSELLTQTPFNFIGVKIYFTTVGPDGKKS
jgi:hypothetical protein